MRLFLYEEIYYVIQLANHNVHDICSTKIFFSKFELFFAINLKLVIHGR